MQRHACRETGRITMPIQQFNNVYQAKIDHQLQTKVDQLYMALIACSKSSAFSLETITSERIV